MVRLRGEAERVLARDTGHSVEQLRVDTDRDRIFTPEQAVEYGLVDQVVSYRKQLDDGWATVAGGRQAASRTSAEVSELDTAAGR